MYNALLADVRPGPSHRPVVLLSPGKPWGPKPVQTLHKEWLCRRLFSMAGYVVTRKWSLTSEGGIPTTIDGFSNDINACLCFLNSKRPFTYAPIDSKAYSVWVVFPFPSRIGYVVSEVQIVLHCLSLYCKYLKQKRKRYDSVLWQNPLHERKYCHFLFIFILQGMDFNFFESDLFLFLFYHTKTYKMYNAFRVYFIYTKI